MHAVGEFVRSTASRLRTLVGIALLTMPAMGQSVAPDAAPVTIGGPFTLTAPDGTTVTDATYRGKWLLVYFGYTFCPDTCPTTLMEIARALEALGPDAAKLQSLFITLDPQRDTPEVMGSYAGSFDPRITALTGDPQLVAAVAKEYGAYASPRRTGPGAEDYLIDHSSYIYLMDPRGSFVRGFAAETPGDRLASTVRDLMAQPLNGSSQGELAARSKQ